MPPDPSGPVFISYRWSDGADHAKSTARRLRASGVPVWLDRDDMPPGEIDTRLREALESGLSGAVMVATPDIVHRKDHDAILDIEAPTIFDELDLNPDFTLAVLNTGVTPNGKPDRKAPARWYGRTDGKTYNQFCPADGSIAALGESMARDRLRKMRPRRDDSVLTLDLQTRVAATSFVHTADLIFRTIPPVQDRVPSRVAFEDLRSFLAWLPHALAAETAREARLVGGAHLTVACAVGAALPETSGIPLVIRATSGELWRLNPEGEPSQAGVEVLPLDWLGHGSAVAVLVDLVPTTAGPTFREHLDDHPDDFARAYVIRSAGRLDPSAAGPTARRVVDALHDIVAETGADLHLFLRTPWGSAAQIGALLNTLAATLYEWDNTQNRARYVSTVTVAPGLGGGPITAIHLE